MNLSGDTDMAALSRRDKTDELNAVWKKQRQNRTLRALRGSEPFTIPNTTQYQFPDVVFVGELLQYAYAELQKAIIGNGLNPRKCWYTNAWKHHMNGHKPTEDHYDRVLAYVEDEISILRPKVVCPIGQQDTSIFLESESIGSVHGEVFDWETYWLIPIEYPGIAFVERKEARQRLNYDLSVVKYYVDKPRKKVTV